MLKLIQLFDNDNLFKKIRLSKNRLNIGIEIKQISAEPYFLSCDTTRKDTIYLINEDTLKNYHEHIQQLVTSNVIIFTYNDEQQIISNDLVTETADFYLSYNYNTIDLYSVIKQSRKLLLGHTKTEFSRKLFSSSVSEIEQIINDSSQRIFWKNTDGRYIGCNVLFANDFGLNDVKEIIGKTDSQLLDEKPALEFSAYDSEIIKSGETYEFSKEIRFKHNEKKTLNIKKYPHKKGGIIIGIIGKYELTEIKSDNKTNALDYSKINEIISDNVSELIFIKDTTCSYVTMNKLYAEFLGIENLNDATGKNDFDFFDNEIAKKYFTAEQKLLFDGEIHSDRIISTAETEDCNIIRIPIKNEKNVIKGIIGISNPIKAIKNESIEQLIAKLGHDIRTPMNGIIGMTEILSMENLTNDQFKMVNIVRNSGDKLLSIIDDVLAISRINISKDTSEHKSFDIVNLISSISDSLRINFKTQQNIINFKADQNIPTNIVGNKHLTKQIIKSLLFDLNNNFNNTEFLIESMYLGNSGNQHCMSFRIGNSSAFAIEAKIDSFQYLTENETEIVNQFGSDCLKLIISNKLIKRSGSALKIYYESGKYRIFQFNLFFDNELHSINV
ncbi:MAG: PAS domain-containing protein [Prolixibacteraceae bacterium]|jgi:PAS domain-containing protein|nr:PAS domain-containing protein [Prolixibacteraceae bacterium]